MNRPILDNVLPTLLGPVRALLDKKADKKEVAEKLGEKANADEVVKTVNGLKPDESGNVVVSGLPEGNEPQNSFRLRSSSGNKVYEITVDDSGTLTTTEV